MLANIVQRVLGHRTHSVRALYKAEVARKKRFQEICANVLATAKRRTQDRAAWRLNSWQP